MEFELSWWLFEFLEGFLLVSRIVFVLSSMVWNVVLVDLGIEGDFFKI